MTAPDPGSQREIAGAEPSASRPDAPASAAGTTADASRSELRFAAMLAALGLAILLLGGLLLLLPVLLNGTLSLYVIADGAAIVFAPIGFSLLAAAWRIRNRAVHGVDLPSAQRRSLRVLGAAIAGIGLFVAFSGFGASGPLSSALNLIWGLSLTLVGVRYLFRSFVTDRA
jgi:hypothetical protein